MWRLALAILLALGLSAPAQAVELLAPLTITTAVGPLTGTVFQIRAGPGLGAQNVTMQANFTYGSGGTTVDAYVQTSLDGQTTWTDVANFHFTTSSVRAVQNVSAVTAVVAAVTASDGGMTANTGVSGMFGNYWRVKYITTGTYAGGTTLRVDIDGIGLTTLP